jgi:hypothetical protein
MTPSPMVERSSAAPGAGLTGTRPALPRNSLGIHRDFRLHEEWFLGAKLVFPKKGFPWT